MEEREQSQLNGTVEHILYHNDSSQYTVLAMLAGEEEVTVVGCIPFVSAGEELRVQGHWETNPNYGPQFRAESFERSQPATERGMLQYLASGAVKGVGRVTATRIIEAFGMNALSVMENDPQRLAQVKGITLEKAQAISEELKRVNGIRELMVYLGAFGVPPESAALVWKAYGDESIPIVQENPYCLCEEEIGLSFQIADAIAQSMECPQDQASRIQAGVVYVLRHNLQNGHICLPEQKLCQVAARMLGVDLELALDAAEDLCLGFRLARENISGQSFLFLQQQHQCEAYIAARMKAMLRSPAQALAGADMEIEQIEAGEGIAYAGKQKAAIRAAMEQGVLILTGGPGTGKTTTLNGILSLLEGEGLKVSLAAPTGRAAKRMTEVTGREAKTIHRLLEVEPFRDTLTFKRNEKNPIPTDAIIVDEMSMVDVLIMESLFRGMRLGCKLILVGDSDQLPSVAAGQVLGDLIASGCVPTVHLDEVFRQAAESLIVVNAHAIVGGELPQLDKKDKDFFFLPRQSAQQVQQLVADLCARRLPQSYGFRPLWDIQVITPMKQGALGTRELNRVLQECLNPPDRQKSEYTALGRTLREGDKVMQIRNNYDILWKNDNGQEGEGVFNGDIGVIDMIDLSSKTVLVRFDDVVAPYTFDTADQLEHAYAITIHKSQGSEFEAVVMPLMGSHRNLHYRNLLYTGVTRARRLLVMAGEKETVARMVQNNRRTKRYTNLRAMLTEAVEG